VRNFTTIDRGVFVRRVLESRTFPLQREVANTVLSANTLARDYNRLMCVLRMEDLASFNFLKMHPATFDELFARIGQRIKQPGTRCTKALEPARP
jgi:hypothetical protein